VFESGHWQAQAAMAGVREFDSTHMTAARARVDNNLKHWHATIKIIHWFWHK